MIRLLTTCIVTFALHLIPFQFVWGQLDPIPQQIDDWFQEERFLMPIRTMMHFSIDLRWSDFSKSLYTF